MTLTSLATEHARPDTIAHTSCPPALANRRSQNAGIV